MTGKKIFFIKAFIAFILLIGISSVNAQLKQNQTQKLSVFTENKGQVFDQNNMPNPNVKYLATFVDGLTVQLKSNGFSYDTYAIDRKVAKKGTSTPNLIQSPIEELAYKYHRIDIELVGANQNAKIIAEEQIQGFQNYYNAITPEKGVCGVKSFQKITYVDIYPGIDLEFFAGKSTEKPVEYNFIIHKNGDVKNIQLKYKGANNAQIINSKIVLETSNGKLTENIPASWIKETNQKSDVQYQIISQRNQEMIIGFKVNEERLIDKTLIIDPTPTIEWATYIGDAGNDIGLGVATDLLGNVYVTGRTQGGGSLATSGAYQSTFGGNYDAFLSVYNSNGTRSYSTYYGGSNNDIACEVALDANFGVYLVGKTQSITGIASSLAQQTSFSSSGAVFLAKFNSLTGARVWSTYYGGGTSDGDINDLDNSPAIAVYPGIPVNVYITGKTNSTTPSNIITAGALKSTLTGDNDVFIARYNGNGNLIWGTYYGGTAYDSGLDIAVDLKKNVVVSGFSSSSTGISTASSHQVALGGGFDSFVMKIDSNNLLKWCTYYGGSDFDRGDGVAVDGNDNIFLYGVTNSPNAISTLGSHQFAFGGVVDAMLVKFNPSGVRQWGTYYGGSGIEVGKGVAVTCGNDLIICGETESSNSISTSGSYDPTYNGDKDVMFARFNNSGIRQWGSYYGGSNREIAWDIATTVMNKIVLCGEAYSTTQISTPNATDSVYGGSAQADGFVAQFNEIGISGVATVCENTTLSLVGLISTTSSPVIYSWSGPGGITSSNDTLIVPNIPLTAAGLYSVTISANGCVFTASDSVKIKPKPEIHISSSPAICSGAVLNLYADGGDQYLWNGPNGFNTMTQNPFINPVSPLDSGLYTVVVTNSFLCKDTASINIEVHDNPIPIISSNSPLCAYDSIQLNAEGGAEYSWSGVNSYLSSSQNPIIHTMDSTLSGTYAVMVTNQYGCTASASTTVEVKTNPKPLLNSNAPVCAGDTLRLLSSSGQSYAWYGPLGYSNGMQNPVIPSALVSQGGWYIQIIAYTNGCSNDDSLLVVVRPNPVITINTDTTICLHQEIEAVASGVATYAWNNGITTPSFFIFPSVDTTYQVTGVDIYGCRDTASFDVNVLPFVEVSLVQNPTGGLFKNQIASYSALPSGYNNYSFYINNNLVQNSSSNIYSSANIADGDSVMVIVSNSNMCFSSPGLGVKVIDIYNSFSPNDDGVNDLFMKGYQITVFNRWGDVMFHGIDGWNGKYNGEDVNTGTYYFTIKYSTADNQEIEYKGDLMLVR